MKVIPIRAWSCLLVLLGACCFCPAAAWSFSSGQLVVVCTPEWKASQGTLQRYLRDAPGQWRPVGNPVPVVVGRNGLAWGIGINPPPDDSAGPIKIEGDGKAPAGAFTLNTAFGHNSAGALPGMTMPYTQATSSDKCVDDSASRHYNALVNESETSQDWHSSEDLLRSDGLYRIGIVVEHNWGNKTVPGRGSCIFLHIWRTPDQGTAGCTAMDGDAMEQLLTWLDPRLNPVFVQLPESEYAHYRISWQLP